MARRRSEAFPLSKSETHTHKFQAGNTDVFRILAASGARNVIAAYVQTDIDSCAYARRCLSVQSSRPPPGLTDQSLFWQPWAWALLHSHATGAYALQTSVM